MKSIRNYARNPKKLVLLLYGQYLMMKLDFFLVGSGPGVLFLNGWLADPKNPRICPIELAVAPDTGLGLP